MLQYWLEPKSIHNNVYIPKYYSPDLEARFSTVAERLDVYTISDLVAMGIISLATGHEIGKAAYGTGDIPFVRTSDITNWEVKTAPKQGVSRDIYDQYATKQDVRSGDILFVRDGTYLIGNNCLVSKVDREILYQSHVLKIRIEENSEGITPEIVFASLNTPLVQEHIRSLQFTADIIDTIGQRILEVRLPIPRGKNARSELSDSVRRLLEVRAAGKDFIKNFSVLIEESLLVGDASVLEKYRGETESTPAVDRPSSTISSEFGKFQAFWKSVEDIRNRIYLPTYYDVSIDAELSALEKTCDIVSVGELVSRGALNLKTGDEIGKMAYGTGEIAFLRTTDFSNWEVIHNPKQGISEEIYEQYREKQDLQPGDILLVRDGTYLVGTSCMVTEEDAKSLYCGGLYRIRSDSDELDPFLLLGLLNSSIVKRQMRTKQFTRDVIDTLGRRIEEVRLPIPKSKDLIAAISDLVRDTIEQRVAARTNLRRLSNSMVQVET